MVSLFNFPLFSRISYCLTHFLYTIKEIDNQLSFVAATSQIQISSAKISTKDNIYAFDIFSKTSSQPDFTANTITFPFKVIITSMNHLYDVFILFKVH